MNLTFKKKRPIFYVSLGIYALLSTFIIVESFMDSGISGLQSQIVAQISSWFINKTTEPVIKETIKPDKVELYSDSSYLGKDENDISNIALGTTTLATLKVTYPQKDIKDKFDNTYTYESVLGNKDDYNIIISNRVDGNLFYIDMRIVSFDKHDDLYQLDIKVAEKLTFNYKFHILDLPAPKESEYECVLDKTNLKIGETTTINTKLIGNDKSDDYLRRYYDTTKINHSSNNTAVAEIDNYGVIHAKSNGSATITFGKYNYNISVSNENIVKPISNILTINKDNKAKNGLSLLDYDYTYSKEDNPNDYSVLLYPSFSDASLEDQSVRWESTDPLIAKIGPYKYDDNGYPIYKDDDNNYCVRVSGYRKTGDVTVKCYSNNDNSIYGSINLYSGEAIADSFKVNLSRKDNTLGVNEQMTVTATFSPKNTYNHSIKVTASNDKATIINNDSATVTIRADKLGKCHFTVMSISNDLLDKYEFDMEFTAQKAINEDNFKDFHDFVRKFAGHFSLFLITAVFGMMFFHFFVEDEKKIWLSLTMTTIAGFSLAGLSELIQYFIPSRGGVWLDVGIDFLGYVIGTAITIGIILLIRFIHSQKTKRLKNKDNE